MAVYFVRHGETGPIKIGHTAGNPHSRISTLQTGAPEELLLLVAVPGGAAEEAMLHERFAALRVRGEWFRAESELMSFIEGLRWAYRDQQPRAPEVNRVIETYGMTREQLAFIRQDAELHAAIDRTWELELDNSSMDARGNMAPAGILEPAALLAATGTISVLRDFLPSPAPSSLAERVTSDVGAHYGASEIARRISALQGLVDAHHSALAEASAASEWCDGVDPDGWRGDSLADDVEAVFGDGSLRPAEELN